MNGTPIIVDSQGPQDSGAERSYDSEATAFVRRVESETSFMYGLARTQLADTDLAADAVQEAILKAWEHRHALREQTALKAWLGTIVIRTCHSIRRKMQKQTAANREIQMQSGKSQAGQQALSERQLACAAALQKLDEEDQIILALKYSEGLNYAQIAAQMNLTVHAVRGRLFRAREELRRLIKGIAE